MLEKKAEGSMGSEERQESQLRASIGHSIIGDSVYDTVGSHSEGGCTNGGK